MREPINFDICAATGKRMYSKADAGHAINFAKLGHGAGKRSKREIPRRAYKCEHCGAYHLTKKKYEHGW